MDTLGGNDLVYRVWLIGSSMTARYDGYVDVNANDAEGAIDNALNKLTNKHTGAFSDWSKSMFKVKKVEIIGR